MNVEKEAFAQGDGIKITMSGKLPLSGLIRSLAWQLPSFHAEPAGVSSLFQVLSALIMGDHPRCCVRSGEPAGFTALERRTDTHGNHDQLPGAGPGS